MKKGEKMSKRQRDKIGASNTGKKRSAETKLKISNIKKGKKITDKHKKKISSGLINSKKHQIGVRSKSRNKKISGSLTGRSVSIDTRIKQSRKRIEYFKNQDNRSNMVQKTREYFKDPKNREKASIIAKQRFLNNPELKEKQKKYRSMRRPWTKEQGRAMSKKITGHVGYNKGNKLSQETKNLIGKRSQERWNDPDYYNKNSKICREVMLKLWESKDFVEKMMNLNIMCNTSIELKIQGFLKELDIEFQPQYRIKNIKHRYFSDIYIPKMNLVIECDGDYWHDYPNGKELYHIRSREMIDCGYIVIRLWERDIKKMDINEFRGILYG